MKGSFEFSFIMIFVMMFLVLGMGLIKIMVQYQDARMLQERIIAHIEVMESFDPIQLKPLTEMSSCYQCVVSYQADEHHRIEVTIQFPLRLPIIDWSIITNISSKTIPLI